MTAKIDIATFDQGIIDELVEPRHTAISHGRGCRRLENMIALPQGPAMTRPPSRFCASTKNNGQARLIRVVYSESISFECEFGDYYVRFYTINGQVLDGGSVYEIASPYTAAEAFELQVFNDAGTLYLTHVSHLPYRLVYSGETSWLLEPVPFTWGPFSDENSTEVTVDPSAVSGSITLTASAPTFVTGAAGHVGALWLIGHRTGQLVLRKTFSGVAVSGTQAVAKDTTWRITTSGTWAGRLILEKTYDGGSTYETVSTMEPVEDNNFDDVGNETFDEALYRLRMEDYVSGTCKCVFVVDPHVAYGYVQITKVNSTTEAEATVVETLYSTVPTRIWAEGAWSPHRGYPRSVGLVDNRLTVGSTKADPTTIWMSHTNRHTDMRAGALAAEALIFHFTTQKGDPFLWILGEEYNFYLGTPIAILQIEAADPKSAISIENAPGIRRRIDMGASPVAPIRAHGTVLMLDASGLRPMYLQYDWQQDILVSPNLAFNCPSLTDPGIKRVVFQAGPIPIVWWLRTDGVLLGMMFEQRFGENLIGWHRHETDGLIEDIDVLPTAAGHRLWWIARRTVDGQTVRHVEFLDPLDLKPERLTAHRLDAYLPYIGAAAVAISNVQIDPTSKKVTVTTVAAHGLSDGENVAFADVGGMSWLNEQKALSVADSTADTFILKTADADDYIDGTYIGTWTGGGTVRGVENSFSNLDHLKRREVYALADGNALGPLTVRYDGTLTLRRYYNRVYIGLQTDWLLQPLRLVLPLADGSTRGRQMTLAGLWLSVYRSWGAKIGLDADHVQEVNFWDIETVPVGSAPDLATCDFYYNLGGGYSADPTFIMKGDTPFPFTIRALMAEPSIHGTVARRTKTR